jgi:hypothetical protein
MSILYRSKRTSSSTCIPVAQLLFLPLELCKQKGWPYNLVIKSDKHNSSTHSFPFNNVAIKRDGSEIPRLLSDCMRSVLFLALSVTT